MQIAHVRIDLRAVELVSGADIAMMLGCRTIADFIAAKFGSVEDLS